MLLMKPYQLSKPCAREFDTEKPRPNIKRMEARHNASRRHPSSPAEPNRGTLAVKGREVLGRQNVLAIPTTEISRRLVVADGEMAGNIRTHVAETSSSTIFGPARHMSGIDPGDLRKMSPGMEVAHVGLATISGIELDLAIVKLVGDDLGDLRGWGTGRDVLAISTTTGLSVMLVHTSLSSLSGDVLQFRVPDHGRSRVIGAMLVMVIETSLLIGVQVRSTLLSRRAWGRLRFRHGRRGESQFLTRDRRRLRLRVRRGRLNLLLGRLHRRGWDWLRGRLRRRGRHGIRRGRHNDSARASTMAVTTVTNNDRGNRLSRSRSVDGHNLGDVLGLDLGHNVTLLHGGSGQDHGGPEGGHDNERAHLEMEAIEFVRLSHKERVRASEVDRR